MAARLVQTRKRNAAHDVLDRGGGGGGSMKQCKGTHPYRFDASGEPPSKGLSIHSVSYDMLNRRKGLY